MRNPRKKHFHQDEEEQTQENYARKKQRHRSRNSEDEAFKCKHCRRFIGALPSGGHHRNHCPVCLYSLHVDDRKTGDRQSICRSRMEPSGSFQRRNGEHVLVHRCLGCGFERFNRIAADDDFELVLSLPILLAGMGSGKKQPFWEEDLEELQAVELDRILD